MPSGPIPPPAPDNPAPISPAVPAPTAGTVPPSCNCGPLAPLPGETPLAVGTSADTVVSQIMLECDDETGVFFFRFKRRLYQRVVKLDPAGSP